LKYSWSGAGTDATVHVVLSVKEARLLGEVLGSLTPSDLRDALEGTALEGRFSVDTLKKFVVAVHAALQRH
jgi:hypothetical protein